MRFLIDAQLPPALVKQLTALGHEAEHVLAIGGVGAPDSAIWAYAVAAGAAIISKDEDFAERTRKPGSEVQVVWVRLGNMTNAALWQELGPRVAEIVDALTSGEKLVEVV